MAHPAEDAKLLALVWIIVAGADMARRERLAETMHAKTDEVSEELAEVAGEVRSFKRRLVD